MVALDGFFQFPELLCDVVEAELDGVEDPELEVFDLGGLVHHPDDLQGDEHDADFEGEGGRDRKVDSEDVTQEVAEEKEEEDGDKDRVDPAVAHGFVPAADLSHETPDLFLLALELFQLLLQFDGVEFFHRTFLPGKSYSGFSATTSSSATEDQGLP